MSASLSQKLPPLAEKAGLIEEKLSLKSAILKRKYRREKTEENS